MPKERKGKSWVTKSRTMSREQVAELSRKAGGEPSIPRYSPPVVQEGIVVTDFCCPVCDSKEYEILRSARESHPGLIGPGNKITHVVVGYQCKGCTTKFSDPRKFTKK